MDSDLDKIEALLASVIPSTTKLYEAARYSLLGSAKRLRPRLVLMTAQMLGADREHALIPACALEIVHTYSLIHDDLPCMDDDDFRRGRPTLHRAYDEATAVLAGDFLLTYAFELLADAPYLSDRQKIALIKALSKASGGEGMIGGQMLDLEGSLDLRQLHQKKTAALFEAALLFGAIIAQIEHPNLPLFGLEFGILFQSIDDLLDEDYPMGRDKAIEMADLSEKRCFQLLNQLPYESSKLKKIVEEIVSHKPQIVC